MSKERGGHSIWFGISPQSVQVFWSGRASQKLLLKFNKDGQAELGDDLHFRQPASDTVRTWTFLLLPGVLNEVKTAAGILTKLLQHKMSVCVKSARRFLYHPFSCLWRIQGMTQGFGTFLSFGWWWGRVKGAVRWQVLVLGFRRVLFCLQIRMKRKIINSIEQGPKLL